MSLSTKTSETLPTTTNEKHEPTSNDSPDSPDPFQVHLEGKENAQNLSTFRKWLIVVVISLGATCVTCASSVAATTEVQVAQEFHVSHEVTVLSTSLYVLGLGFGPLIVGPLSEVYGRNIVYRLSYFLFFVFSFPVAFAPDIAVYLVFRFITGLCGAAFLSVAGGSVSDLFSNAAVASPMALYTASPFIGPALGPMFSGFINQNTTWRWTYRVQIIWVFVELAALVLFVPETYSPVLLKAKAQRLRKETGNNEYWAPLDRDPHSLTDRIKVSIYRPFELTLFDQMALLLNTWTSLLLGILYLAFQAFPIIFEQKHGFNLQETGLSFLGIGIGMVVAVPTQVFWNRLMAKEAQKYGHVPPESRLIMGEVGGILVALGLFWLAFTTYASVPWIVPIIASIPFGAGVFYVFTSVFTYLVTAYRPIAASAMAANTAMRTTFAAVFPLFAGAMYDRLGTVGATALLAGLTTLMVPLPFIYHRIGARIRQKSRFASHDGI